MVAATRSHAVPTEVSPGSAPGPPAVVTEALTKRFDGSTAVDALDLVVPAGRILGYLGPNGAGKTTTMRLWMGLLRPTSGRAWILGLDAWAERDAVHRRVGYLPGEFNAHGDLTGGEYLRYLANLRGDVETEEIDRLVERFGLDPSRPVRTLSHGNRRKVGLVQACMHRPELLILDEPTSGLDPLVQQEFAAFVREFRDGGGTVVLSSHVLDEVEAVADDIAVISDGALLVVESVATLKSHARHRLDITFVHDPPRRALAGVPGVEDIDIVGRIARILATGSDEALFRTVAPYGIERVVSHEADLEEIFLSYFDDGGASC